MTRRVRRRRRASTSHRWVLDPGLPSVRHESERALPRMRAFETALRERVWEDRT